MTSKGIGGVIEPALGDAIEIVPGILWLRLPLPFRLNHVNIYILEDKDGWTIFDTGLADAATRTVWSKVIGSILRGAPITKVIVSHFHIDHVGLAGWFQERFSPTFYMSQTEYLLSRVFQAEEWYDVLSAETKFFNSCGLNLATQKRFPVVVWECEVCVHLCPNPSNDFAPVTSCESETASGVS